MATKQEFTTVTTVYALTNSECQIAVIQYLSRKFKIEVSSGEVCFDVGQDLRGASVKVQQEQNGPEEVLVETAAPHGL